MTERVVYNLIYPVKVGSEEVASLSLRRPKTRDMIRANKIKDDLEKVSSMICDLAEVTPAVVNEMDAADFAAVGEMIGNFMTAPGA